MHPPGRLRPRPRLIEKGHDHHEREANANRQTTPRWHRQKLDEANDDRPDGQWPAFLKRRRILGDQEGPKANVGRMIDSSKAITLPGWTRRPDTVMDVNLGYPCPKRKFPMRHLQQVV